MHGQSTVTTATATPARPFNTSQSPATLPRRPIECVCVESTARARGMRFYRKQQPHEEANKDRAARAHECGPTAFVFIERVSAQFRVLCTSTFLNPLIMPLPSTLHPDVRHFSLNTHPTNQPPPFSKALTVILPNMSASCARLGPNPKLGFRGREGGTLSATCSWSGPPALGCRKRRCRLTCICV
eukprot:6212901-Pleurochrysis_carterae.AAC.3